MGGEGEMSVAAGLVLAYLKIGSVAAVIIGVLMVIIKVVENRGRKKAAGDR